MSFFESVVVITGMFLVTFGVRFVLFARAHKVVMPEFVEKALRFVPVAVLTAIITPMILMPTKTLDLSWHNPWLIGGVAAFTTGVWRQNQLLTISVGVVAFFVAKYALNF